MATAWTILKMIGWMKGYFEEKGVPNPRLDAEHLLAHSLGLGRIDLYLQYERILTKEELARLRPLIERRARREPLQHIIGTQPFRDIDIRVDRRALIPRPETEITVEEVLKHIPADAELNVLELGVGSGAIAAALASEREKISITGVDISRGALALARENTEQFGERISLLEGDLFEPVKGSRFDIIVSNPPYCPSGDWQDLQPEVRDFEPEKALVAGKDGLDFHRRILSDAAYYLKPGGWLILEFGDGQRDAVLAAAEGAGGLCNITIHQDLNHKDRILSAQPGESNG